MNFLYIFWCLIIVFCINFFFRKIKCINRNIIVLHLLFLICGFFYFSCRLYRRWVVDFLYLRLDFSHHFMCWKLIVALMNWLMDSHFLIDPCINFFRYFPMFQPCNGIHYHIFWYNVARLFQIPLWIFVVEVFVKENLAFVL